MRLIVLIFIFVIAGCLAGSAQEVFETDVFQTDKGDISITFIGHGTLMMQWDDKVIHVDPWSRLADYDKLPKADLVLVTHEHGDHLDPKVLKTIGKPGAQIIITEKCKAKFEGGFVMANGDGKTIHGIKVEAVPAYNIKHKRDNGQPFHPKGEGNGYVLTFGGKRIYVAGYTEDVPEMKSLKNIDVAFLPMNVPYTMTPEMVASVAKAFQPKILYPYHFGSTDTQQLVELLEGQPIEIRIRKLQ